jgi:hypothetical protein
VLTRQQAIRGAQNFVLIFLSIGIVALYSSWRRPIWFDEYLQYAWGAFSFSLDSLSTVVKSNQDGMLNNAQTGVYMVANLITLNFFGANSLALRLPSLLAAILLLVFTVAFFRTKGFSFLWQTTAIFFMGAQTFLMYFSGEARPYMPLAAAVVGLCVYYTLPLENRKKTLIKTIGWFSGVLGALFHPYIIFYAFAISILFSIAHPKQGLLAARENVSIFFKSLNPALLITIGTIWLVLFIATWGRQPKFIGVDPFFWQNRGNMRIIFSEAHFVMLPTPYLGLAVAVALVLIPTVSIMTASHSSTVFPQALIRPTLLVVLGLLLSVFLILTSYFSGFWILSRQWVASMAMVVLGFTWYLACLGNYLRDRSKAWSLTYSVLVLILAAGTFSERAYQQTKKLNDYAVQYLALEEEAAGTKRSNFNLTPQNATSPEAVHWANINILSGGPVWPEFRALYSRYENSTK